MVYAILLHPDLGIGGAERLVVDAALALKQQDNEVLVMTNHHDVQHCFPETKDGTLPVIVAGDWIPRSIFGICHALCAYLRMLYLTLYMIFFVARKRKPDVLFCDQIPIGLPFIRWFGYKVIFYCHFPDQLLSIPGGDLKELYRKPIDWIEETSIKYANRILVNSMFTLKVFQSTFTTIRRRPEVVFPSINTKTFDEVISKIDMATILPHLPRDDFIFLSINRFERKKNLPLAIRALQALETVLSDAQYNRVHLVMMGGYDERVTENIEVYDELVKLCEEQKLESKVTFLKSPSDDVKIGALNLCTCVIYTPAHEHFGIVPLEGMYAKKPVIAVQSGGPKETVGHEQTGFLTEPVPEYFAHYMAKIVTNPSLGKQLGEEGRSRFASFFSFHAFTGRINRIVETLHSGER